MPRQKLPQSATQLKGLPKYLSELVHVSNLEIREHFICLVFSHSPFLLLSCCPRRNIVTLQAPASWFIVFRAFARAGTAWRPEGLLSAAHQKPQVRGCYILQDAEALTLKQSPIPEAEQVKFPIISMYRSGKWAAT